jgi:hypothetical protein
MSYSNIIIIIIKIKIKNRACFDLLPIKLETKNLKPLLSSSQVFCRESYA